MRSKLVLLIFLCVAGLVTGQGTNDYEPLKIGVVLSGGGAKGMAHIGVLKVIEEAGISIDYIGGTSMGAIVGALYASGYSATELDSIFRSIDFNALIRDEIPRDAKTFYEKENSERYALTLPFDNFKVSTPQSYSGGQSFYNELVRLLYHVKDVKDFSKLPIPFLCIATDAETGKEVLLNNGYLPKAVSASAALPSLFEPTIIDDKVLLDGGIINNYPISEVKDMGADIIIGSDVQHGLADRDKLLSALEILEQINNYRTVAAMGFKALRTDIYIKPEIEDFSVVDFQSFSAIVASGVKAANLAKIDLIQLSDYQKTTKEPIKKVKNNDTLMINRLIIADSLKNYSRGYIKGKLRFELGKEITFKQLKQGISNLRATGNFKTIHYKLERNNDGEDLVMYLNETENRTFLRLAAHYDDLYKSSALLNITHKGLLTRDDVASLDFILGDNVRYNFQYYIDKGSYWSFGINSRFNAFEHEIDAGLIDTNFDLPNVLTPQKLNLNVTDFTNQLYVQTVIKEEFAFTTGVEHKYLKFSTRTFGDELNNLNGPEIKVDKGRLLFEKSNFYSAFGQLKLDTYDDRYFPSRGLYFSGQMNYYMFSSDFNNNFRQFAVAKARMGTALPILKNLSLTLETEGGFKLGSSGVTSFDFALGGFGNDPINNFIPFLGYDFLGLPGNSFVKAYGSLDFEFAKKHHLMFAANFANVQDDLFRTGEWFTEPNFSGYGVSYGWESFLGPLQVLYAWSPEGNSNVFFSIGYWF